MTSNNTDSFPLCFFPKHSKPCLAGKFGDSLGGLNESVTCKNCPFGFYQSANSSIECTACTNGQYGDAAQQTSSSSCKDCGKGKYLDQQGQSTCKDCLAGQFGDTDGATIVTACKECPGKNINKTALFLWTFVKFLHSKCFTLFLSSPSRTKPRYIGTS